METYDKIQYTSKENSEGVVLDSPSKGKTSETSVAVICIKGAAAIVCNRLRKAGSEW